MLNCANLSNLTFGELWQEYNDYIKIKLKSQSYRKMLNLYENHLVPFFKDFLITDISAKIYLKFMLEIENKNYKNSYKKSLHSSMVAILNYACKFYDLKDNVASKVGGFNKNKGERKNVNYWTLEEFKKFIDVVHDPIYNLLFNTLYFTGLRLGECLALTWNDFKDSYLDINKTITKDKDKNGNYIINSPKTTSSFRVIQVDNQLVSSLNKMYNFQKEQFNFNKSWYIFGGNKPLSQTTVGRKKNAYCEVAGVKKIRLHDFRHSHATLLVSCGVPITVISQRLGHSDFTTTLNTYSHLVPKDEDKAINLIDEIKCGIEFKY